MRWTTPAARLSTRLPSILSILAVLSGVALPAPRASAAPRLVVMLPRPVRYEQLYISSCEAAATHIAMQMAGVPVPEQQLIAELPMDRRPPIYGSGGTVVRWGDPYQSFVGDITRGDSWPMVGYGVYAPPILRLLWRHGLEGSYGGSHLTAGAIRHAIDAGLPVIVWVPKLSLYDYAATLERRYWLTWQGSDVPWTQNEHAQVVVGYDDTGFYLDNPDYLRYSGGQWLWHYTWAQFQQGWDVLDDQALIVARGPTHTSPSTATATPRPTPTATASRPPAPTRTPTPRPTRTPRPNVTPTATAGLPIVLPPFPPWPPTALPTVPPWPRPPV